MNGTSNTNGSGNGHVLKWLLGILTVALGGFFVAFFLWLVATTVQNSSELRVINARLYGLEHPKQNQ